MIKVRIDVTGIPELKNKLHALKGVLSNIEPELKDVGEWLLHLFSNEVFETKGAILGEPWAPISKKYAAQKMGGDSGRYAGRGILQRTGELQKSWHLYTASQYALLNNPVPYARFHQLGTSRMPKRVIAKVTSEMQKEVKDRLTFGLLNRVAKSVT